MTDLAVLCWLMFGVPLMSFFAYLVARPELKRREIHRTFWEDAR